MLLENSFIVAGDEAAVWAYLLDVERIAPCLPGAELTEVVDDRTWKGRVQVRFGPVAVNFGGTVTMTERDDVEHRATLVARGTEQRGRGAATATVEGRLEAGPGDGETTVRLRSEVSLSGAVVQFSRGVLPDVARSLTERFAECLRSGMQAQAAVLGSPPARPVRGISLAIAVLWRRLVRLFRRGPDRRADGPNARG